MYKFTIEYKISGSNFIIWLLLFCIFSFALTVSVSAQQVPSPPDWDAWQFILGDWLGEGGGYLPAEGSGNFSFYLDLQDSIIVRKNHSDIPATNDHSAYSHDDLMIIYQEPGKSVRAIYFDNEGHIINYTVTFSKEQNSLIFLSDINASEPRFRITYIKDQNDTLTVIFERAPQKNPEVFSLCLEGVAQKKDKKTIDIQN
jgi:hypothetical protein